MNCLGMILPSDLTCSYPGLILTYSTVPKHRYLERKHVTLGTHIDIDHTFLTLGLGTRTQILLRKVQKELVHYTWHRRFDVLVLPNSFHSFGSYDAKFFFALRANKTTSNDICTSQITSFLFYPCCSGCSVLVCCYCL